jgi:hypothetical protein
MRRRAGRRFRGLWGDQMLAKGTQRRFAVSVVALTALAPVAAFVRPAFASPPKDPVSIFNDTIVAKTHIAKLKQTISPPAGTFKGTIDRKTGQLTGAMKLPPVTFADPAAGLATATAAFVPTKQVVGHMNLSNKHVVATATFVLHIVTASTSAHPSTATRARLSAADQRDTAPVTLPSIPVTLPSIPVTLPSIPVTVPTVPVTLPTIPVTLPTIPVTVPTVPVTLPTVPITVPIPPVNMVGDSCVTGPITVTLQGLAQPGMLANLTGKFTIPKLKTCGTLTGLLNSLLPGSGNTFSATTKTSAGPPSSCTLPTLPITLPTLPVTVPNLPVTLPTIPCNLPTLPLALP